MKRSAAATLGSAILAAVLTSQVWAQDGKLKTQVSRSSSNHTTIVIHDTRPEAYARHREEAIRAQQFREAEAQRRHELELAKIQAEAQVRSARLQSAVAPIAAAPAPAPAPVRAEPRKPSYRNGGRFTGFSEVYGGGFGFGVPFYGGYGGGFFPGGGGFFPGGGFGPRPCPPRPPICR